MKEKIIDGFLLLIIIALVFALLIKYGEGQRRKEANLSWSLSKAEQKLILNELNKKNVGDCIVEPILKGWKCTDNQGKIYTIARR
jgi:hypothetical protein